MVKYAIVADIGGTNARFSRVDFRQPGAGPCGCLSMCGFCHAGIGVKLLPQRTTTARYRPCRSGNCLSQVNGDLVKMTNFHWQFSIAETKAELALAEFIVLE